MLILMHGVSGSGKSWLSRQLVPELRAVRIRSDLERKRMAGIQPAQPAAAGVREGIYSRQFSHQTYARLAACAETCLRAGFDVIVDAAFLDVTDRELFRALAKRVCVRRVIVSCQADPAELAERIVQRSATRGDPSDATLSVLDTQLGEIQPFEPAEQAEVFTVNTGDPEALQRVVAAVREHSYTYI